MELTREEEAILRGEEGEGYQKAMEILVALGKVQGAQRLIPVRSAQVSGVSPMTIGEAGMEFLRDWASSGVKARIYATLNPAGVDLKSWRSLGYPAPFVRMQDKILKAYTAMGIVPSCTCTPYLVGNLPAPGESVAWAESSSVIYANSVLNARTNRESGVSALASALLGRTPYSGLHLDEDRKPTLAVDVTAPMKDMADYAALGYAIGKEHEGVPLFRGLRPGMEELKILGAALAVGPISMFRLGEKTKLETIEFDKAGMEEAYAGLNTTDEEPELVCVGCPHASPREMRDLAKLKTKRRVWAFTARQNKVRIGGKNLKVVCDTCMVVSPLKDLGVEIVGVNSAKAAYYCAHLSKLRVRFGPLGELLR
ncbi:MAG: aconitase X catalytic domain-containing protein [Euryarchaeota archaeon]|nr:aconitase X catalytic domain-containing protein [Euryarchaeota archaeon]